MNVRTLRETLDDYGYETEKVLECLLDVWIRQHVSDKGVLAQDVAPSTGVLLGYNLVHKQSWGSQTLFTCTPRGERIAKELFMEGVEPVFEKIIHIDLEGSYFVLKYFISANQGNTPVKRPELRLLLSLPVIQELQSSIHSVLLEHGLSRYTHQVTASGPSHNVAVTVPDLFAYFKPYYKREKERIQAFEQVLTDTSRNLNLFRLLYSYEPRAERIYLRKIQEYKFTVQEITDILDLMKQKNIIVYSYNNPIIFKVQDREAYRTFLKENVLSEILQNFSRTLKQRIHTNPQAYAVLAEFEKEFRTFLEKTLKKTQENWEKRIPQDILERLKERQNDARIRRKTLYPLLHYIDFPNYLSIILHRNNSFNNWDIFEPYFVSIGWIKGRLIELNEIRNDLAHPKPLEPLQYRKLQLYIDEIRERIANTG